MSRKNTKRLNLTMENTKDRHWDKSLMAKDVFVNHMGYIVELGKMEL